MAWIESHETLKDHPKLHEVCAELGVSRPTVIGHLHLLWWWCINYALDGTLRYKNVQIARAAMWEGDADVFVNALLSAGFIDKKNDELSIHDWRDFCGSLIDKRLERKEERTRGSRTAAKRRKVADKNGRLSPNQPYHTNHTIPTIPIELQSVDGMVDAWSDWETYRREAHKPLTESSRKAQWGKLLKLPDPVGSIRQSIERQWQGLFEVKDNGTNRRAGAGQSGKRETFTEATIARLVKHPAGPA